MKELPSTRDEVLQWDSGGDAGDQGMGVSVLEYAQLLWYRKKLILAITLFFGVVGWIQVNQIRSVYTANATLMLGTQTSHPVDIESVVQREYWGDQVLAEIEVLKSRGLARKVVERLRLQNVPEFNPGLREPEESIFDFLKYLNPRTWVPQAWKDSVKEALGMETQVDTVEPLVDPRVPVETVAQAGRGDELPHPVGSGS